MRENGFDESHPIQVTGEAAIVVDGHTRLRAAIALGIKDVPVVVMDFDDEDAALRYSIHNQRDRRNWSTEEILRCVAAVDKRVRQGGDHTSKEAKAKRPGGLIAPSPIRSREETADFIGVSPTTVQRARTILNYLQLLTAISVLFTSNP